MNLASVMQEIGDRLGTIPGLRVHAFPPDKITPPAAIVSYPDSIDFDATYGRGMDTITLPVWVLVGRVSARAARADVARFADGSGSASIKAVVESGVYTTLDNVRVAKVVFRVVSIAAVDYLAAQFTLEVTGKGA